MKIVSEMPGATPIQGQGPINSSNSDIDCVEKIDSELETNSKRSSLSSTCSSMSPSSPPEKKAKWSPIRREVSHCDSEPSMPHPLHSDAAVRAYSSVTNSPNQIWVSSPPTPLMGDITPNTAAINLIQSLAEGRVIVEEDQISHVKGVMNPISAGKHVPIKDSKTKEILTENDQNTYQNNCEIIPDDQDECKMVRKGNDSIQEMLAKQVNYGNKIKYTEGRANRTKNTKKIDLETEKKRQIQELVKRVVLILVYSDENEKIKRKANIDKMNAQHNVNSCSKQMVMTTAERNQIMLENAKCLPLRKLVSHLRGGSNPSLGSPLVEKSHGRGS